MLDKIVAYKKEEVAALKARVSPAKMAGRARKASPPRDFLGAIAASRAKNRPALIAEIKKASPSKGLIRADFDPAALAKAYEKGGATCLSVLTDGPSFQGSREALVAARAVTKLPVLRKDFMVDPYQVAEARAMGADCILVIMACTPDRLARELLNAASDLGMAALVEVHNKAELARAMALQAALIGINNRDLKSFETRLETTEALAALVSPEAIVVSESGISLPADIERLSRAGAHAFLVGESLMRQKNVEKATKALLAPPPRRRGALSHLNARGEAAMVDVGDKAITARTATAEGYVVMEAATLRLISAGAAAKGDVLAAARIAGIMAAKRTHDLIPLCHPLPLTKVAVAFELLPERSAVRVQAMAKATGQTGVEMEALTAVSVACLTLYDMLKARDRAMRFEHIRLLAKSGGKSGDFRAAGKAPESFKP